MMRRESLTGDVYYVDESGYWQDAHWGQGQTPRPPFLWLLSHEQFDYMKAFAAMVSALHDILILIRWETEG